MVKKVITSFPNLMEEWNYKKNVVKPSEIAAGTSKKIWWICEKGHEWEASGNSRLSKGRGCPYCSNQKVCKDNCLETTHPELLKEWNYRKNIIRPDEVSFGADKKVWWFCDKGHEWEAHIYSRTNQKLKAGCPYCSGRFLTKENCLYNTHPKLSKEWHPLKNKITSKEISFGSRKKIWWICKNGHEWKANLSNRATKNRGCPYCSNQKVCKDNCLETTHPELLKEWNYRNITKYNEFTSGSNKKVWWICKNNHEWQASIVSRVRGNGCPHCSKTISKSGSLWLDGLGISLREQPIKCGKKTYRVDGLDKDNNIVYEFLGDFWHGNPKVYNTNDINPITKTTFGKLYLNTLEKLQTLDKFGYKVIFMWEMDWKTFKETM